MSLWMQEEFDKDHKKIIEKVIKICEDIARYGSKTRYQDIFDIIYEQVDDKNLHIPDFVEPMED